VSLNWTKNNKDSIKNKKIGGVICKREMFGLSFTHRFIYFIYTLFFFPLYKAQVWASAQTTPERKHSASQR